MLGFPTKGAAKFFLAGDEDGGVAGTAGRNFARNLAAGDLFGGVEDFEDGKAAAVAHVEGFAGNGFYGFESAEVGIGDIEDVDVVADTGAVGGRVVRAEDFDVGNNALRGVENFWNEMGFDAMMFAAFGGSASGVEIAESGVLEAGVAAVVRENFFEAKFGFAVGVDGVFGMIFGDGDGVGFAVGGGGG